MIHSPSYYANIPADVRYDKSLKANAKLLYGEITALCNREGHCWAENSYFADLYQVDDKTISRWISQLRDRNYIGVELLPLEGNRRKITIDKKVTTSPQKRHEVVTKKSRGSDKKSTPIKENITINNTINISGDTAFDFLEKNAVSMLEATLMKIKSGIKEFDKFKTYFNLRMVSDKVEYNADVLCAKMQLLANTWTENQNKDMHSAKTGNNGVTSAAPKHERLEIKRRG